jgi:hypothetical protein
MKAIDWDPEKNVWLKSERGICFEDVLFALENDNLLDRIEHPNQLKYPGQKMLIVEIKGYAYLVPYSETEATIFLKTIFPSRKATRKLLRGGDSDETDK